MAVRFRGRHQAPAVAHAVPRSILVCAVLLAVYGVAIFLDLPSPAGNRYEQALPAKVLAQWSVVPSPGAQPAPHWWSKGQGLRGWSVFPEGWSWPKQLPAPLSRWIAAIGLGLAGAVSLPLLERRARRRRRRIPTQELAALSGFAYLLQLVMLWFKAPNVEALVDERIADPVFSGYLTSALHVDRIDAFFTRYSSTIRSLAWCSHCRTHPPGPVLFYWVPLQVVERLPVAWQASAARLALAGGTISSVGMTPAAGMAPAETVVAALGAHAILLGAALIVFPLYGLARLLAGDEHALALAALGAVLPAVALMSPEFDQLYGTFAATLLLIGLTGLAARGGTGLWGFAAGLFLAFCLFWSIGLAVLAAPLAAFALIKVAGLAGNRATSGEGAGFADRLRGAIYWLAGFAVGVVLPWALLWYFGDFQPLAVMRSALAEHLGGITAVRPYLPWVVYNVVDFLQFLGLPVVIVTLLTLASRHAESASSTGHLQPNCPHASAASSWRPVTNLAANLNAYGVVFWGFIIGLDLSGTTRAEVGRLWIPFTPLALLAVFHAVGRGRLGGLQVYALLVAQLAVCLLIGANWLTP